jgi:hypothetical protein
MTSYKEVNCTEPFFQVRVPCSEFRLFYRYAECRHVECRFAECRGTYFTMGNRQVSGHYLSMCPIVNAIKLFFVNFNPWRCNLGQVSNKHFQPSLIFAGETASLYGSTPISGLTGLTGDKHSSIFAKSVS